MHSRIRSIAVLTTLALTLSTVLFAQQQETDQTAPTFKSQVNVVNLFFNVKDKHGALVPGLTRDEFEVTEDGKPQTIKYFSAETNQPLTLGILIDSSGSQTRVLDYEKEAGAAFLNDVIKPKDEAFVISFDVNVDLLEDFTNSARMLRTALDRARINTGGGGGCGGIPGVGQGPLPSSCNPRGTLLYDAVYLASHDKLAKEVGRKAMIILTDGEDQGSQLKIRDAIEAAQKADAICYVILIADSGAWEGWGERSMRQLATETGGRVVDAGNKPDKLKKAFDQIASELRSQYSLGYTPTNSKLDGTFRKVAIHTKSKDLKIQTRTGYYAVRTQEGD